MHHEEKRIRDYIQDFRSWIASVDNGEFAGDVLAAWSKDLQEAEALLGENSEMTIAMLGPSQQGKSTLINSLLGENILAVGGAVGPCTSVITSVHYEDSPHFRAQIDFISLNDWKAELRDFHRLLDNSASLAESTSDEQEVQFQKELATEKLKAVYRIEKLEEFDFNLVDSPKAGLPEDVAGHLVECQPLILEEKSAQTLRNKIKKFMVGREQHADSQYWPLVAQIRIHGRFACLERKLSLVDLPGLDDPNPAREQITRNYMAEANNLWLVCNSQTGITNVFKQILRDERLLLRLFLEGRLAAFSVVATQADNFNLETVLEQMGISPEAYDGELSKPLEFRREKVLEQVRHQLHDIAQGIIDCAENAKGKAEFLERVEQIPVFVLATAAYQHAMGRMPLYAGHRVSAEDSHIPALAKHLATFGETGTLEARLQAAARRLDGLYKEYESFCKKKEYVKASTGPNAELLAKFRLLADRNIADKRQALDQMLASSEKLIDVQMTDFLKKLETLDEKAVANLDKVFQDWGQLNWKTFRAAIERKGRWHSKQLIRRIDLNQDVASAFLSLIPLVWDEFFERTLLGSISDLAQGSLNEMTLLIETLGGQMALLSNIDETAIDYLRASVQTADQSFKLRVQEENGKMKRLVGETRHNLAGGLINGVCVFMAFGYQEALHAQGGKGIKERQVDILASRVRREAPKLFASMRQELVDGLAILKEAIHPSFRRLHGYSTTLISQVESNLDNSFASPNPTDKNPSPHTVTPKTRPAS